MSDLTDLTLSRERRVDWARMVANLQKVGMSLQYIADHLGVGKRTVGGYIAEDLPSEPAHWTGHCLTVLWCERLGLQLKDVPTRVVPLTVSQMLKAME